MGKRNVTPNWLGIIGTAVAACISWSVNQSILWAIFHASLSWIYVIYYAWVR